MITVDLGNRIRELRKQTGLSQEKFALKIGMDRTYFASVENGKRNIAIINIQKIFIWTDHCTHIFFRLLQALFIRTYNVPEAFYALYFLYIPFKYLLDVLCICTVITQKKDCFAK